MPDVCFFEAFEEEATELKRFLPPRYDARFTAATIQEDGATEAPAPIISIRTQSLIPESWLLSLDAILTRSTGYDHLLWVRQASKRPIQLGHLPVYCARAVAEQAMILWMALLRRLPAQQEAFKRFHRDGLTGREAGGRKLAVIGVGRIGIEVVRLGQVLGMQVVGVDLEPRHAGVDYTCPEEALTGADVVVTAMNLTAENRGYFTRDLLARTARGAVFINVSRGELSPADGLLELLKERHLGGVGLDVYDEEKTLAVALREDRPPDGQGGNLPAIVEMMDRDDVILTPHNAFNTREAVERKSSQSVEQLEHLQTTGRFLWSVPG